MNIKITIDSAIAVQEIEMQYRYLINTSNNKNRIEKHKDDIESLIVQVNEIDTGEFLKSIDNNLFNITEAISLNGDKIYTMEYIPYLKKVVCNPEFWKYDNRVPDSFNFFNVAKQLELCKDVVNSNVSINELKEIAEKQRLAFGKNSYTVNGFYDDFINLKYPYSDDYAIFGFGFNHCLVRLAVKQLNKKYSQLPIFFSERYAKDVYHSIVIYTTESVARFAETELDKLFFKQ